MTLATTLREKVDSSGISLRELARQSGLSKSYIDALLAGTRSRVSLEKAQSLARVLGISVEELTGRPQRFDNVMDLLEELRRRCESLGMMEVPVRGYVPCQGEPREQTGTVVVPKSLVGGAGEGGRVFALECCDPLADERIEIGDFVVVDPSNDDIDDLAHVYALYALGETCLRRAWRSGAHVLIAPHLQEQGSIPSDSVKVLGRVVLSGRWRRV